MGARLRPESMASTSSHGQPPSRVAPLPPSPACSDPCPYDTKEPERDSYRGKQFSTQVQAYGA